MTKTNELNLSVIAPCFNEQGNILSLCEKIINALKGYNFEIILVNDGSSDQTKNEMLEAQRVMDAQIVVLNHSDNLGIPAAWSTGIKVAKAELVCFIDSDLQNPPAAILQLYRAYYSNQCDVVQAVRSSIGRVKDNRFVLSRGLNFLLNSFFLQSAKDSKSGFLLGRKIYLEKTLEDAYKFNYFQTFIGVALRSYGFRVVEVETLFESRNVGKSFLTKWRTIKTTMLALFDFAPAASLYWKPKKSLFLRFFSNGQNFKLNLGLSRRIRFELFFMTMPLHKWIIGRKARGLYIWLKEIEFVKKEELEKIRFLRLQELVYNSYLNVPYYKKVFDQNGFKPSDLKSIDDIAKIPLLSKDDVRENIHFELFSNFHDKKSMHRINTSGSTGEPFICYADKFQLEMRFATTLRALEMTGYKFGDKQLRLWHQTLGMSFSQVLRERIDAFFMRRKFIPAFEMTRESIEDLVRLIEGGDYKLIDGYAESLNLIASFTRSQLRNTPKGVISSAQQLTPETRARIENLFGTKVYDKYGSREFSGIAYQCDKSLHHHVQDESYIVEILVEGRPAAPGEVGEVVVTDLNNFSVPLIRYRIGDLAVAVEQTPCECKRPHTLIGEITGRTQAMIACANGVWLPGGFFGHFFKDFEYCIKHYQVAQEEFGEFTLKIVPTFQFSNTSRDEILDSLYNYAGRETKIDIEIVDQIPLIRTGKRSPVVSSLRPNMAMPNNIISKPNG